MENSVRILELEDELKNTKEELNKVIAAYDDFIHLASHDLQSPIRKVSTLLDRFLIKNQDSINDDSKAYIERIHKSLAHLTSLISDITTLSEFQAVKEPIEEVNLNNVVSKVFDSFKQKNIKANFLNLPFVFGNNTAYEKLFNELITNSEKYKKADVGLEISISSTRIQEEEKLILNLKPEKLYSKILYHDNGIGFNNEMAERIMKPFQRLHGNATYSGNGIGLAICKKIVESNGGVFFGQGKENEGATFSIILPEYQK